MKKELFNKLIENILAQPDLFSTHKVTVKDGLEVHTFGCLRNTDMIPAKTLFKEKGYKMADVHAEARVLDNLGQLRNTYLTVLYAEDKDKISISTFESGYGLAFKKSRYFPVKKNTPVFAYTKKMYGFKRVKKGMPNVRIQMGAISLFGFSSQVGDIITKTLFGIDYVPKAKISYRHFINTKSDLQAIGKLFGTKVPEVLKMFIIDEVLALYKTIKDFNQINKLCQFIAKEEDPSYDLYETIAEMLFGNCHDRWLVQDAIGDSLTLKKRGISFSVTSKKRWIDDHNKATKLRMLAGVPEIEVGDVYKEALKGLEYPCELIESKDRLVQESVELHHCVATYANKINAGTCAIFSIEFEEKRYTLEVQAQRIGKGVLYKPVQFRGLCNEAAPDLIGKRVAEVLNTNSDDIPEKVLEAPIMEPIYALDI